jgi:hypothetical protein
LGKAKRAGLVATNSLTGGKNRLTLDAITRDLTIFEAWSDEPWIIDGAAVRVSLVCFGNEDDRNLLDGASVAQINSDLTSALNITDARPQLENAGVSFIGIQKTGPFDLPGQLARQWLRGSLNPNGKHN